MNKKQKKTQQQRIIDYLKTHKYITQLDSNEYLGISKLATRISELKRKGYIFNQKMITVKNRFGEDCRVMAYEFVCYIKVPA